MRNPTPTDTPAHAGVSTVKLRFIASLKGDSPYGWRVRDLATSDVVSSDLTRAQAIGVAHYMNVHAGVSA